MVPRTGSRFVVIVGLVVSCLLTPPSPVRAGLPAGPGCCACADVGEAQSNCTDGISDTFACAFTTCGAFDDFNFEPGGSCAAGDCDFVAAETCCVCTGCPDTQCTENVDLGECQLTTCVTPCSGGTLEAMACDEIPACSGAETPTNTPTSTPTTTPTSTPSNTPTVTGTRVPEGGACMGTAECAAGLICVEMVCTVVATQAPALSGRALGLLIGVMAIVAFFGMRRHQIRNYLWSLL